MRKQGAVWRVGTDVRTGDSPPVLASDVLWWCDGTAGSVEIADVAVNSYRRQGIGKSLVKSLLRSLPPETVVWAATRTTNEIAQLWYESMRFEVAGVLRRMHGTEEGADCVVYLRRAGGPI